MHFLPPSCKAWETALYSAFRAYVLLAFLGVEILRGYLPRHGDMSGAIVYIILGYVLSFLVFLGGGVVQLIRSKRTEAGFSFLCAVVTFLIGFHSLRYLAG